MESLMRNGMDYAAGTKGNCGGQDKRRRHEPRPKALSAQGKTRHAAEPCSCRCPSEAVENTKGCACRFRLNALGCDAGCEPKAASNQVRSTHRSEAWHYSPAQNCSSYAVMRSIGFSTLVIGVMIGTAP